MEKQKKAIQADLDIFTHILVYLDMFKLFNIKKYNDPGGKGPWILIYAAMLEFSFFNSLIKFP